MANAVCDIYLSYAEFHTAVELVDDAKVLSTFVFNEGGKVKFVIVKKT